MDAEHVYSRALKRKKIRNDQLREAFHAFDVDHNGSISSTELAIAMEKLGYDNLPPRFARDMILKVKVSLLLVDTYFFLIIITSL